MTPEFSHFVAVAVASSALTSMAWMAGTRWYLRRRRVGTRSVAKLSEWSCWEMAHRCVRCGHGTRTPFWHEYRPSSRILSYGDDVYLCPQCGGKRWTERISGRHRDDKWDWADEVTFSKNDGVAP